MRMFIFDDSGRGTSNSFFWPILFQEQNLYGNIKQGRKSIFLDKKIELENRTSNLISSID